MKPSHIQTPRTLNECAFTPGYRCAERRDWGNLFLNTVVALGLVFVVPLILMEVL